MKSRLLIGGLCAVVMVSAAGVALADVFTGRIAPGKSKVFTLTTDTSTILEITAIANHERTDLDILVTVRDGADDVVVADSASGRVQLEEATVGLPGATEVTITLTNADGPNSRFTLLINEPGDPGVERGARYAGEFDMSVPASDPEMAGIQDLVRKRAARRR